MSSILLDVMGADEHFYMCRVEIDSDFLMRAVKLASHVVDLGVYKVVDWDYRVIPMSIGDEDDNLQEKDEVRLDCVMVNIKEGEVFWSGYVKHDDRKWETQLVPLDALALALAGPLDLREGT